MKCDVKIVYVGGNYTELAGINYDFVIQSFNKLSNDNLIFWHFNNKDFVINMKNVDCVQITKL